MGLFVSKAYNVIFSCKQVLMMSTNLFLEHWPQLVPEFQNRKCEEPSNSIMSKDLAIRVCLGILVSSHLPHLEKIICEVRVPASLMREWQVPVPVMTGTLTLSSRNPASPWVVRWLDQ